MSRGEQPAQKVGSYVLLLLQPCWIFTLLKLFLCSLSAYALTICPLSVFHMYMHLNMHVDLYFDGVFFFLHYKDLTEKQREKQRKREGGRGKVSAGLPDASRQVSVHTVL